MATCSVNEIQLQYQRTGDGTPLVLLAGMASDSASWQPVMVELAKHAELITLDNRCSGRTLPCPVETSRTLMVNDVLALLDSLQIDKAVLMGHSMGGMLAWAIASQAPDRVRGLICASAPFTVSQSRIDLFQTLSRLRTDDNEADWFRLLFQFLFSAVFFADEQNVLDTVEAATLYPYKQSRAAFAAQCQALPSFLPAVSLPKTLPFPALAITGCNDRLFGVEDLHQSYKTHPEVSLETIRDAAHSVHWENPTDFVALVTEFLNTLPPLQDQAEPN